MRDGCALSLASVLSRVFTLVSSEIKVSYSLRF